MSKSTSKALLWRKNDASVLQRAINLYRYLLTKTYTMNRFFTIVFATFSISLYLNAQEVVYDQLSMGQGYENMLFYSFDNGLVAEAPMAGWDLSFDIRPMGSTVNINLRNGTYALPFWGSRRVGQRKRRGLGANRSIQERPYKLESRSF